MSSSAQELAEIREAKKRWLDATATEESVKLQRQIEEKKKVMQISKKKAEKLIVQRSKSCRQFYAEQYAAQRAVEKQEVEALSRQIVATRSAHARAWKKEHEESREIAEERAMHLHRAVRTVSSQRRDALRKQRDHDIRQYARIRSHYPEKEVERTSRVRQQLDQSLQLEDQIKQEMKQEQSSDDIVAAQWARDEQHRREQRLKELEEKRVVRKRQKRIEDKLAKSYAAVRHNERQCFQNLQKIVHDEQPGRTHILFAERSARWELCNLFKRVASVQYVEDIYRRSDERRAEKRYCLTPTPDASDMLRADERSAQRSHTASKHEAERRRRVQEKHERAVSSRKQRLALVKSFVCDEAEKAQKMRMEALERRRGERLATETEPYIVAEGVSQQEEYLPSYLQRVVVDIIRENTTKDDIDFNTL